MGTREQNSIATRLIIYTIVFSSLITIVLTAAQLFYDYSQEVQLLKERIAQIKNSHINSLTLSLWNFDNESLRTQLQGILNLPDIEYLEVISKTDFGLQDEAINKSISVGKRKSKKSLTDILPLIYKDNNQNIMLGKLTIVSSLDNIINRLLSRVIILFLSNTFTTFLVAIFIFFIFQFLVTRHLRKISKYAANIIIEEKLEPLRLDRKNYKKNSTLLQLDELDIVVNAINTMNDKLKDYTDNIRLAAIGQVTAQVAHDIRSPLTALNVVASSVSHIPEEQRILLRSSVKRIQDIANNLLIMKGKDIPVNVVQIMSIELLSSLVEVLVSEKRTQYRDRQEVIIEDQCDSSSYGAFAEIDPVEFKRIISNLINNSVEALEGKGKITVSLSASKEGVSLIITDTGKGIPQALIERVFDRGVSFGKTGGSGLGLAHAKETIEKWGGKIDIISEEGVGTTITLLLKREKEPAWFLPRLVCKPGMKIIVIDDDPSIHQVWQSRFREQGFKELNIEEVHCSTSKQYGEWYEQNKNNLSNYIMLSDYELLGESTTGLDIIEKYNGGAHAVLVTSRFEEASVRSRCAKLGVKLLPKGLAGLVPIKMIPEALYDAILIDDDPLVHMMWNMRARDKNMKLKAYTSAQEFMNEYENINKAVPLYVDSHLSDTLKGEDIAKNFYETGFKEIYLCTGYMKDDFPTMSWIKDILSKEPPF